MLGVMTILVRHSICKSHCTERILVSQIGTISDHLGNLLLLLPFSMYFNASNREMEYNRTFTQISATVLIREGSSLSHILLMTDRKTKALLCFILGCTPSESLRPGKHIKNTGPISEIRKSVLRVTDWLSIEVF